MRRKARACRAGRGRTRFVRSESWWARPVIGSPNGGGAARPHTAAPPAPGQRTGPTHIGRPYRPGSRLSVARLGLRSGRPLSSFAPEPPRPPGGRLHMGCVHGVPSGGWILVDQDVPVGLLRTRTARLVEYLDLETTGGEYVEFNTETINRPIRLPGQRHVEIASLGLDQRTFCAVEPEVPSGQRINLNELRFSLFLNAWAEMRPTNLDSLFVEAEEFTEERPESQKSNRLRIPLPTKGSTSCA